MKKTKVIGNVLFWVTLISPIFSFFLASLLGEANIFGVAGIIRYSWVMWFSIPWGILSIIIGKKMKNHKQKYKKNYIIAFICIPLLIIWGSYTFIFSNYSYDINTVTIVENKINLELPKRIKIATSEFESYNLSYVRIIDEEDTENFEYTLETNPLWKKDLSSKIRNLLPFDIQYEIEAFDYFLFYNSTCNEYNTYPLNGEYECVFIAYDYELQRFIILDDLKLYLN